MPAFAKLAACAQSSFALSTAMAAMDEPDSAAALDTLEVLKDYSLLNYAGESGSRFLFHPLLHEFAGELAKERGLLHEARARHSEHFFNIPEKELSSADLDDLLQVADFFRSEDNFGDAIQVLKKSYSLLEKTQDYQKKVFVLNSLGGAHQRLGQFDKAVEAFKKSAEIGEELQVADFFRSEDNFGEAI